VQRREFELGKGIPMRILHWALVFFVVAIIAAIFGFGNIAAAATDIARILFFIFIVVFALLMLGWLIGGKGPPPV
jgi:uncharacterized membrane protein YtjA (UPF0391 family)